LKIILRMRTSVSNSAVPVQHIRESRENYCSAQGGRAVHRNKKQVVIAEFVMSGINMNFPTSITALKVRQKNKDRRLKYIRG
jgi:hypothetical protein